MKTTTSALSTKVQSFFYLFSCSLKQQDPLRRKTNRKEKLIFEISIIIIIIIVVVVVVVVVVIILICPELFRAMKK